MLSHGGHKTFFLGAFPLHESYSRGYKISTRFKAMQEVSQTIQWANSILSSSVKPRQPKQKP